jgi:hypothetical protein
MLTDGFAFARLLDLRRYSKRTQTCGSRDRDTILPSDFARCRPCGKGGGDELQTGPVDSGFGKCWSKIIKTYQKWSTHINQNTSFDFLLHILQSLYYVQLRQVKLSHSRDFQRFKVVFCLIQSTGIYWRQRHKQTSCFSVPSTPASSCIALSSRRTQTFTAANIRGLQSESYCYVLACSAPSAIPT